MSYPGYPPGGSGGSGGYPPQPPGPGGPGYPGVGGLGFGPPSGYPNQPQQGGPWMPSGGGGGGAPYPTPGSAPYPSAGPAPPYPGGNSAPYPSAGGGGSMPGGPAPTYPGGGGAPYPMGGGPPTNSAPYPGGSSAPYPGGSSAPYPGTGGGASAAPYPGGGNSSATPYPAPGPASSSYPTAAPPYPQKQAPGGYMNAPPPVPSATTHGQSSHRKDVTTVTKGVASMTVNTYKEPVTEGTLKASSNFNAESDAGILRKAMKGFGTDEKAIIGVVGHRSWQQRQDILRKFKAMYGKDLIKELKSELSGHFEDVVIALFMTPREYDAYVLRKAIKGAGTDEMALIEVLCTRNNEEIKEIKARYKSDYSRNLESDVRSDTSGDFRKLLTSMLTGAREPNGPVDLTKAKADAQALYDAGEGRWGTDESRFNQILASRSIAHLRVVFDEYSKKCKYDIEQSIDREMSGDLRDGMIAVVQCVRNKPAYFAERLYKSMKGLGTDDSTLIRVMVSRCEVDMVQIKAKFYSKYDKTLGSFIKGDCSGDYRRILLAMAGERY